MPRKPHKIGPLGKRPLPDAVIALQASRHTVYGGDADEYGRSVVNCWHAACLRVTDARTEATSKAWGADAESFWKYLRAAHAKAANILIVSQGAREHAAALGLWDQLLEGTYFVDGMDPLAGHNRQGYVVLEAPPTIIRFAESAGGRLYTWIDPINFGSHACGNTCIEDGTTAEEVALAADQVRTWYATFLSMCHMLRLGSPEHTAASQAAAGFRNSYMEHGIYIHDNEAVLNMERAALFGGRNECLFIGTVLAGKEPPQIMEAEPVPNWQAGLFDGPADQAEVAADDSPRPVVADAGQIHQLDFNSLYPACAAELILPVKLAGVLRNPSPRTLIDAALTMPVVAAVRVNVRVPCVPVWIDSMDASASYAAATRRVVKGDRDRKRMIFPTGDFTTVLCGPEVKLAAECGNIVSCGMLACYEGRPIYRRWVHTLYEARKTWATGDVCDVGKAVKSILNASFAKWAQLKRRWQDQPNEMCPWPWDQWWRLNEETDELEQWRCFAWHVQQLVIEGEPGDSFPAITACINSYARVKLWNALQAAGKDNVYYMDTDSLWVNDSGLSRLRKAGMVDQTALGFMKIVDSYDAVEFFGLKRYFADGKLTCGGSGDDTVRTSDAFALALRPSPAHSFLRMHRPPGIDRRTARLRLRLPYRHGIVRPDGRTEPFDVCD